MQCYRNFSSIREAHFIGSEVKKGSEVKRYYPVRTDIRTSGHQNIRTSELQNIRTSEHQNLLNLKTFFRKNNIYYCSDNIKHYGADNTYCFYNLNK